MRQIFLWTAVTLMVGMGFACQSSDVLTTHPDNNPNALDQKPVGADPYATPLPERNPRQPRLND